MDDLPPGLEAGHAPAPHGAVHDSHDDHAHEHHELGFIRNYIFSTDHKVIGIQYLHRAACVLMFFGFTLMMLMRWQLAFPDRAADLGQRQRRHSATSFTSSGITSASATCPTEPAPIPADPNHPPLLEWICGKDQMPGGVMTPDFYNTLGAMHGTIMVFFAIVPDRFRRVRQLRHAAADRHDRHGLPAPEHGQRHPLLHQRRHHARPASSCPAARPSRAGTPTRRWPPSPTSRSTIDWMGHPRHRSMAIRRTSRSGRCGSPASRSGSSAWRSTSRRRCSRSVNFITTIVQLRAKGLGWMRLPFFVWTQFVTAFLLLLAFPPLEAAAIMQLMDRLVRLQPLLARRPHRQRRAVARQRRRLAAALAASLLVPRPSRGVRAHPARPRHHRRGRGQQRAQAALGLQPDGLGLLVLGFLSMIVWAHHMYLTGMGTAVSAFFQLTTIIISIPTILVLASLIISLWGGAIRFTSPMLWATRVPAALRHRRPDRHSARLQRAGHLPARHLLYHRPFPLRHRAGHHLRLLRRHHLLVPQGHRPDDERDAGTRSISGRR